MFSAIPSFCIVLLLRVRFVICVKLHSRGLQILFEWLECLTREFRGANSIGAKWCH